MSLAEAHAELARSRNVHDFYPQQGVEPKVGEDWITKEECRAAWENKSFDGGWYYKNHYSACQVAEAVFNSYVCSPRNPCRWVGSTVARMTVIGRTWGGYRYVDWDVYLDKFRLVWGREFGYLRYIVNVSCDTFPDGGQCTSDKPDGVMRSLGEWRANGWAYIHTETSTPNPVPDPDHPDWTSEQRGLFKYTPSVANFSPEVPGSAPSPTPYTFARCDNASYITNRPGCIYPASVGILHLDYNSADYKQSVQFIYAAMHHLDQVMPDSTGRYVPGGYFVQPVTGTYEPLHRNKYGNRSRSIVRAKCIELYGPDYTRGDNGTTNECDEYPFSATYENANYVTSNMPPTFAVKPVLDKDNGKAGNALEKFLDLDHILDWDPFYVAIDNAPSS